MTVPEAGIGRSRRSLGRLAMHQYRADLRCFLRNKQSVFFTLALPLCSS